MAAVLLSMDKPEEAESLLWDCLVARRQAFRKHHPDTFSGTSSSATVLQSMGKMEQAESLHWECVVAKKQVLGEYIPTLSAA